MNWQKEESNLFVCHVLRLLTHAFFRLMCTKANGIKERERESCFVYNGKQLFVSTHSVFMTSCVLGRKSKPVGKYEQDEIQDKVVA